MVEENALAVTAGEKKFEEYLRIIGSSAKKDQSFGIKKPDYLVATAVGSVLCEIKDFGESALDSAAIKAALLLIKSHLTVKDDYAAAVDQKLAMLTKVEASNAGGWDPFPRLQEMVAKAAKQLRPAKGKLPCVVVIYNPGYMPHQLDLILQQAMAKNRLFTRKENTTVSAIAVLEEVEPEAFSGTEALRLRIYRNRYAVKELVRGAFPATHAVEVSMDEWSSSKSPLIGQQVMQQSPDYTCNHCGALAGVIITADDPHSQEWTCGTCHGKIVISKVGTEQHGSRGAHGPRRDFDGEGRGCCLAVTV